ncbi:DeoR/GlpR family DNA-binding transcription regulator [Geminicoccus roseus]|uniref:DeoR/GlpR family DNA-binding transcription regulator n=1 Tax=Geminicoccus roseus TaxID=404900 RepID=UPI0003FCF9A8|nr:DeoR/GlpR family DNA-binding transcription regulator [Geminicoccus roseus]
MTVTAIVLPEERQRAILTLIERDGRVLAAELARDFGTSEDTIRRDLRELAATGRVQRVHGGAVRQITAPRPYLEREQAERPRKQAIARVAAGLIRPGEVVIVDAGSTNLAVMHCLPAALEATIVTNSPAIASALLGRNSIEVILLGGSLSHRAGAVTGTGVTDAIRQIRADLCLLGACSLSADDGLASVFADDAVVKRTMIEVSGRVVTAVLNDKLGASAPFTIAPLAALDQLVIEADAPAALVERIVGDEGPEILRAPGETR